MLSHFRLDELTEQHLLGLIENKVPESHTLEYKRETYGTNDKAKKEFLKDVSAFANADGGDLIIGIAENDDGVAIELKGISKADVTKEHERLEQIFRSGLEPTANFQSHEITIRENKSILIFRTPASDIGPHRVKFAGTNKFHIRGSRIIDEPDVEGLRKMFLAPYLREQKIRKFVDESIILLQKNDGPVQLKADNWIAIHIIPLRDANLRFGYGDLTHHKLCGKFSPIDNSLCNTSRSNIDGVLIEGSYSDKSAYSQLFRNGSVIFVQTDWFYEDRGGKVVSAEVLVYQFMALTRKAITNINELGVHGPYALFWTLAGMEGKKFKFGEKSPGKEHCDRDLIKIPEIKIDKPFNEEEMPKVLRPLLDMLWQAAGYNHCFYFDKDGNWTQSGW